MKYRTMDNVQTQNLDGYLISLFPFSKREESRLKDV
jgi:hypothetical protein